MNQRECQILTLLLVRVLYTDKDKNKSQQMSVHYGPVHELEDSLCLKKLVINQSLRIDKLENLLNLTMEKFDKVLEENKTLKVDIEFLKNENKKNRSLITQQASIISELQRKVQLSFGSLGPSFKINAKL